MRAWQDPLALVTSRSSTAMAINTTLSANVHNNVSTCGTDKDVTVYNKHHAQLYCTGCLFRPSEMTRMPSITTAKSR